ncbi:hypothetical protein PTSG_09252 [Salpingoeca rosetta]|uniref:Ubiquitin-like protein ATG12 n=1 Tax=Salpingoeca rosetta (strain ATCC 50818 / BSB-021) TaxID=946362 RepID=F2UN59_SALR5|nr:uncharacterized protein PTSG_09252 [Salpingoeca rosetta]EGD78558.1 hypothetical protein PTSG_09252 [Salpingoeca rosetta]|eukprot:XP_004989507.1 hypothetical protein PTSG_09252 [Salpingoeca rosetta]
MADRQTPVISAPHTEVLVTFTAAAGAPQLKESKRKIKVKSHKAFQAVVQHLQKLLDKKTLFVYINQISPSLDATIGQLAAFYGHVTAKGTYRLPLQYSVTPAWG